ncbi:MAG: hypothetical protein J0M17_11165 [Planctomycetes bacterium]|nr:hypothetical protein [Planctomycetota bacterium]
MTPNAEVVHQYFRGASEVTKKLRFVALFGDLAAATIAVLGVWGFIATKSGWLPLLTLLIATIGIGLRTYASSVRSFALSCRKSSIRAFALDEDLDPIALTNLQEQLPPLALWFAKKLPASNLEEYYEPTVAVGTGRLCELYAHSAFYTRRLARIYGFTVTASAVLVFVASFAMLYHLAMDDGITKNVREAVVATICSTIFVLIFARLVQLAFACLNSVKSMRRIENELLKKPKANALRELVDEYDIERASSPDVPTAIYKLRRNYLQRQWHIRRTVFTK